MKLSEHAAAWWSAWKWVAVLLVACLLLAWLNVWQWKRAIAAPLRDENRELNDLVWRIAGIAENRDQDDAALMRELQAIADRGQRVRVEYRTVIKDRPLPADCAPGQERVDTVNRALRAPKE